MTENASCNPTGTPHRVNAGGASFHMATKVADGGVTVIRADRVEVECSPTLKYLGVRSGYIEVPNRVFIVSEDGRREITVDSLPDEWQES